MRTALVLWAALVSSGGYGPVLAQNIDAVDIGHKYYLYRFSAPNEPVEVVRIDRRRNRVQVKNAQQAVDWVRPAELLTSAESVAPDSAAYLGAAGVVLCMLDPTTCSQALRYPAARAPRLDDRNTPATAPGGSSDRAAAPRAGYGDIATGAPPQPR